MKHLRNHILLLLLLWISEAGLAQQIRFRNVLGNTGYDYGMSAQQTFDGGYIVCGSTTSVGNGNTDIYVIKTDSLGKPVNERSIGGINVERGTCIRQTADSGYVVLGYSNDTGGGYDIVTIKTDGKLNVQWKKTYGGNDWDFGNSIRQTTDGGYIICGGTYSYGKGDEDYYVIKTNAQGDTLWTKTYGSNAREEAKSIVQTKDGGYILTGFSMANDSLGNFYTIKLNAVGDTLWTNTFGGTQLDLGNDVLEYQNGGYIVAGETRSFGAGKSDGILVEISPAGKSGRTFILGGVNDDSFQSICERSDGKVMIAGLTDSHGTKNGKGDIYFSIMNPDWTFYMSTTFGSDKKETVNSVSVTSDKGAIICGSTNGFRNLLDDIFLIKTDSLGFSSPTETILLTSVQEQSEYNVNFSTYPNPAHHTVYLHLQSPAQIANLELVDITGRIVKQQRISLIPSTPLPFQVDDLDDGVYILKLTTDRASFSKKIVVKHEF